MEHDVDRLGHVDELDAVVVAEVERVAPQALDVLQAARVEVVEADHAPVAFEQVLTEVRTQESGAAGHDCSAQCASRTVVGKGSLRDGARMARS